MCGCVWWNICTSSVFATIISMSRRIGHWSLGIRSSRRVQVFFMIIHRWWFWGPQWWLRVMQTAFQHHNLITPFSLLKRNLTEMMDKLIATVDCAFQWFQLLIIARDDVSPVTFAILKVHLIHAEWVSNVLCFSKKVRFCELFCVLIFVDTVTLWRCCYRWLGILPLHQRHDLI